MVDLEHFWPFGSYLKYWLGAACKAKREREGRHPLGGCKTSQKNGRHLVKYGPILAFLGSKWPQRRDLLFGTMFFNAKMTFKYSKCLQKVIGRNRKGIADQKRPFYLMILVSSSHFHIQNTVPNDRSNLCGHLEPKMVKIGPKLTEWWPFF